MLVTFFFFENLGTLFLILTLVIGRIARMSPQVSYILNILKERHYIEFLVLADNQGTMTNLF